MALVSCRCIDKTQGVVLNGSYSSYGWYQITTIWHPSPCDLCNSFTLNYSRMLNSQLPHESYRVYFANIVILYNDWWQRRDLKWSLIHSYRSRLLADHGSNFGEFACQTSKLQKSSHAHLFQVIKLSRKRGSQKWATVISFLFMFYYIFFFSICNFYQMFYKMYLYTRVSLWA